MNSIVIWSAIKAISEIPMPHIFTEEAAANIRKFAEIRLTDLKNKYLRKNGKPKKMRKAK